ncbi:MAG: response regulator transcription factor [Kiritimatiellales bacterium]|jgi:DNA-binding NarL/FixJ family response regulator
MNTNKKINSCPDEKPGTANGSPVEIWIIEDDSDLRQELQELLNTCDDMHCGQAFSSYEQGLPYFRSGRFPDLLLVDIHLPGMTGIEAIQALKALRPALQTVVLTGSENKKTVFDAICAGASGYLLKSDSFDDILRGIRLVIAGGSPLSGPIASMVMEAFRFTSFTSSKTELSEKEKEILRMLADGLVKKEIASGLCLTPSAVDYYLRDIYQKLQVHSQAGAVGKALRKGLI